MDIEVRLHGSWQHLGPKKVTNTRGRVVWHTAKNLPRNRYALRLHFDGDGMTKACSSDTFRLPRR